MNYPPPPPGAPQFQSEELKKYLLTKQGKGPLFAFLLTSSFIFLAFLVSVLKPHRYYKKLLAYIYDIKITINNYQYKVHHFLLLLSGFYGSLYFFLLMQGRQNYPNPLDPYRVKMEKLDRKWVIEAQTWLAFLNVVCLLSIYKNSHLFNTENNLIKQIEDIEKELGKKKKNE